MKEQSRDMSEQQFRDAAAKSGFKPDAMGYWRLAPPVNHVSVYRFNAGTRRRAQLAYMLSEQEKAEQREVAQQA